MNSTVSTTTATITLPSVVDIAACQTVQPALYNLLAASNQPVVVDARVVERISTPGIQLLLSFLKTMQAEQKDVVIGGSSVIESAFVDLGLASIYHMYVKGE